MSMILQACTVLMWLPPPPSAAAWQSPKLYLSVWQQSFIQEERRRWGRRRMEGMDHVATPLHPQPLTPASPSGTSVWAHETAGVLQKPIITPHTPHPTPSRGECGC